MKFALSVPGGSFDFVAWVLSFIRYCQGIGTGKDVRRGDWGCGNYRNGDGDGESETGYACETSPEEERRQEGLHLGIARWGDYKIWLDGSIVVCCWLSLVRPDRDCS